MALAVVPQRTPFDFRRPAAVGLAATTALAAVVLERVERWLVRRPQPYDDPFLVAADDAIRTHSVQVVARAGIAVFLLVLGASCWKLATSDVQALRWTMWPFGAFSWWAAVWSCWLQHEAWTVRRRPLVGAA